MCLDGLRDKQHTVQCQLEVWQMVAGSCCSRLATGYYARTEGALVSGKAHRVCCLRHADGDAAESVRRCSTADDGTGPTMTHHDAWARRALQYAGETASTMVPAVCLWLSNGAVGPGVASVVHSLMPPPRVSMRTAPCESPLVSVP
jgi:hypothetical protein